MMKKLALVGGILFALVFTRFFNVNYTTRFTRDESSNLVDIHRIYLDREVTMLGPIDPALSIIYPSLSHYLHLPGAVIGNFEPYAPAYSTAAISVATAIVLLFVVKKINKLLIPLVVLLAIVWFPLLESGRWAWNPHLVPIFGLIALYLSTLTRRPWWLLSGVFFGLTFHLHYVAFVCFGIYYVLLWLVALKKREFIKPFLIGIGFFTMIIPFIYFDLKNPPGLFFGRFMQQNLVKENFWVKVSRVAISLPQNISQALFYMTQSSLLSLALGLISAFILIADIKKRKHILYALPFLAQLAMISLLPSFQNRYVLLGIPFFLFWLIQKRDGRSQRAVQIAFVLMIIGSTLALPKLLTTPTREPDSVSIKKITDYIQTETNARDLKNTNLAVLASVDPDPIGEIYRHMLLVRHSPILGPGEYHLTDNLFVITTAEEEAVRADQANVMGPFRRGPVRDILDLGKWKVYLFNK